MSFLLWHGAATSAQRHADRPAVRDAGGVLTHSELDAASDRFCVALQDWSIGRGDHVGILMPKSARSIVVMLGTTKAGAAYVPVDPAAPARRAALILGNAGVRVLVTTVRLFDAFRDLLPKLSALEVVVLVDGGDRDSEGGVQVRGWPRPDAVSGRPRVVHAIEDDPAYILYTSGSTGTPKGVVITHRNALTFVNWALSTFDVRPEDRLSNHAPLHFDLSVFDIYAALHAGACVCLVPDRIAPFPGELARWIEAERITIWYSVPSALTRLLKLGELERFSFACLRIVLFAGEVFPVKHLREVMVRFERAEFFNLYGPTETNVCTFCAVPRPIPADVTELSIGAACANYDVFAITDSGTRAPAGAEGELAVRGPGVMSGYWGLPERTAQSLVQNPLHAEFVDPIYRTGDVVRVEADGTFTFLGRRDHMVKTRGYRVELGEIEHVLHEHRNVATAAVIPLADDEIGARLWAAVVAEGELSTEELLSHCAQRLPHYSVPERIIVMKQLPHTSTGKIDRQQLAASMTTQSLTTDGA